MITIAEDKIWQVATDKQGFLFQFADPKVLKGSSKLRFDPLIQERTAILRILHEQGDAVPFHNGMRISWENACALEPSARQTLDLPSPWAGSITVRVNGLSGQDNFDLFFEFIRPNKKVEVGIQPNGALISIGREHYLASALQFQALDALHRLKSHKEAGTLDKFTALSILKDLRAAKISGLDINLDAYDDLEIIKPNAVRVSVEEQADGGLILTPDLCQKEKTSLGAKSLVDPVDFENRYEKYIGRSDEKACVPVEKKLVLLDERSVRGIREIARNRHISPERREAFLSQPTAWLNAQDVDLDLGFSNRVRGASPLKVAYFGETDDNGIEWFETKEPHQPTGGGEGKGEGEAGGNDDDEENTDPIVLDIELSDEGESPEELRLRKPPNRNQVSDGNPDLTKLHRKPYPHQISAVRWLKSLSMGPAKSQWEGALLADDMGLGKTFSVLAFLREYISEAQLERGSAKPCLIVAPVSLLIVWKRELQESLNPSPFSDPIILHSSEHLARFKKKGKSREVGGTEPEVNAGQLIEEGELDTSIQYSLRIGEDEDLAGPDCLGLPNSIVITNYETVRDYQFSLARIQWSVVVFDEAQAIKNPNSMVTRAAKALNAEFAVVMTGTPVENSLRDFWCLMDRVQPGYLNNYQPFRREFMVPILEARREGIPEQTAKVRNEIGENIRERVGGLMLRRLKIDHLEGLPTKTIVLHEEEGDPLSGYDRRITCEMSQHQQEIYDQICLQAEAEEDEQDRVGSRCVLAAIQNLRTASLHPDLIIRDVLPSPRTKSDAKKEMEKSGKLKMLLRILSSVQKKNEKILIFVINKRLQTFLQSALQSYFKLPHLPGIINGDTKIKNSKSSTSTSRIEIIDTFSERKGFDILILSPVAAGVGLTITGANHVVHLERHWNPAKEAQATDRVYRIGQEKPVTVWVPILMHPDKESFDQKLDKLISVKSGLSNAVVTPDEVDPSELFDVLGGSSRPPDQFIKLRNLPSLKWDLFEALIAEIISCDGAERVILTPSQNDKGCDVVVLNWNGENWLIQCKHKRNPRGPVGYTCVTEIVGSRSYYEESLKTKFEKLAVFANVKHFDVDAKKFSKINHVPLFGLKKINKLLPRKGLSLSAIFARNNNREKV